MGLRIAEPGRGSRGEPDLRRAGRLTDLTSASVPPPGPEDHARGEGDPLIVYLDLGCPRCAIAWAEISRRPKLLVFRHFPITSKHPRAAALHAAAEAAGAQGHFFEMVDSLYTDRGRVDDPHLWSRAEAMGLDLQGFETDRRSAAVSARVQRDFESGLRAGVVETPALFEPGS